MFRMPQKYPIGIQDFAKLREGGYVYVDKTPYIYELVTSSPYYFLSRPRRFGKSLLMSTIMYLYQGRKDLFKGLYIEDKWDFEKTNPVIYIPLNGFGRLDNKLETLLFACLKEHFLQYELPLPSEEQVAELGILFHQLIKDLHKKTGRKVVVLIDEYDKPLIDFWDKQKIAEKNREILKGFYGILKPADPHLEFVFLTGITRFSKVGIFSDLNNLKDISLRHDFGSILGINQQELETLFHEEVAILAEREEISVSEMSQKIKSWYNGYLWNPQEPVYNPFSLLNFFDSRGEFKNYWFSSGTPNFLVKGLANSGTYQLDKLKASAFELENFQIEAYNPITLLYQAGYLTVIEEKRNLYTLDFPNQEVRESFSVLLLDQFRGSKQAESLPLVLQIVDAFEAKEIPPIFEALNGLFSSLPNLLWREKDEHFYHALTHLTFQLVGVYLKSEVNTSRGRCDSLVETDDCVYALEFKLNGDAKLALQQIFEKGYLEPYRNSGKELIALGINFTTEKKGVSEWEMAVL